MLILKYSAFYLRAKTVANFSLYSLPLQSPCLFVRTFSGGQTGPDWDNYKREVNIIFIIKIEHVIHQIAGLFKV